MHLINKLFGNKTIRTVWDKTDEKYYISVIDMVEVLSESENPRDYWYKVKKRAKLDEKIELSTICRQLKLKAKDGKYRLTDVVDIKGMFRIIESIPSKNAESIKLWLARLGSERIDETFDPSIAVKRAIDIYRAKDYDENWITKRIKGIQDRKKLTDVWKENGVTKEVEYAILTNEIYKEWSGMTAKDYKEYKGLRKESLRDNMSDLEVLLVNIGEITTKELAREHKPNGLEQNIKVAKIGGSIAKNTRNNIEKELGKTVITNENNLNYKYKNTDNLIKNK